MNLLGRTSTVLHTLPCLRRGFLSLLLSPSVRANNPRDIRGHVLPMKCRFTDNVLLPFINYYLDNSMFLSPPRPCRHPRSRPCHPGRVRLFRYGSTIIWRTATPAVASKNDARESCTTKPIYNVFRLVVYCPRIRLSLWLCHLWYFQHIDGIESLIQPYPPDCTLCKTPFLPFSSLTYSIRFISLCYVI